MVAMALTDLTGVPVGPADGLPCARAILKRGHGVTINIAPANAGVDGGLLQ
jgi:hypothetical protein